MKTDKEFTDEIRRTLDEVETDLSTDVRERLSAARREAISQLNQPARRLNPGWALSGAGLATAALVAVLFLPTQPGALPEFNQAETVAAMDMELLDDLELLIWILEEDAIADL